MAAPAIATRKECSKCGVEKPADTEHFNKKLDGLTSQCRPCRQEAKRKAWKRDADKINAKRRASRDDDERAKDRARYAADPEKKRKSVRAWRKRNPDKRREIDARQYQKFKDKKKAQAKRWSEENAERKRQNLRAWYREKRRRDPAYRLRSAVSAYLYWCLKSGKNGRRTEDILGYSMATLRAHLERQFLPGMRWDNYGEWHVDHIRPMASFDFQSANDAEFRACWSLANLRPLWAADNLKKSDRRTHLI